MKKTFFTLLAATALILVGCNKNEPAKTATVAGVPQDINISLITKALPTKATTEVGTVAENKLSWLEFYVFDSAGALDTQVGGTGYLKITTSAFNHKIRVTAGTNKKFLVVANASIGAPAGGDTYDVLKAKLSTYAFAATDGGTDHNSRSTPTDGFEMSGTATATIVAGASNNQVYVTIARLVSKINAPTISVNVAVSLKQEQIDEVWGEDSGVVPATAVAFAFKGYAVINGITKSNVSFVGRADGNYATPITAAWDTWSATGKANLNSSFEADGSYKNNYSGQEGGGWLLDGTTAGTENVYVFENKPTSSTQNGGTVYTPSTVYSYIIQGELSTAGQTTQTRYWRVDLTKTDIFHIMRNSVYKVAINKISTPGYKTPEDAETLPGVIPDPDEAFADFVVDIAEWDIKEETTEM